MKGVLSKLSMKQAKVLKKWFCKNWVLSEHDTAKVLKIFKILKGSESQVWSWEINLENSL